MLLQLLILYFADPIGRAISIAGTVGSNPFGGMDVCLL
jgi:hypothetical protein